MKAEVNCGAMAVSGIEHPVRVIGSSDEEDDPDPWKQSGGAKSDEMYHVIGVHDSDWSIQDQSSLMRVNVELDNDDNYNDGDDDDDDGDDDDGRSSGRCSEGNKTASAADLFWSADDSSLDIRGHQAKYEMEVVEQEATRTSIVLMPNTTLSDDDEHDDDVDATLEVEDKKESVNLEQTVVRMADISIAGSLDASRGNVNMSTQPQEVVVKMNFGTQTLRHRSTQTNVDQSTQAGQGRIQKRGTKTLQREEGLPRSEEPRRRYGMQEQRDKFSGMYSKDSHVTTDDIRQREMDPNASRRNEMKNFGQQTLSNSFTQTPLLIRLSGGCGDPEGLKFGNALCSFDFANDGELLLQPLILPSTHDSGDRHLARVHQTDQLNNDVISRDPDDVMSRDFATQTFGQMSNSVDDVQTQTESGSTWNALNHTDELVAVSSSNIVQTKSSHRKTGSKELLNENEHGIKKGTKSKDIKTDDSRKKLLKFMLDQVRKLRDEADNKGHRPHKGRSHKHHRGIHEVDMVEATPVRSKHYDDKQKRH